MKRVDVTGPEDGARHVPLLRRRTNVWVDDAVLEDGHETPSKDIGGWALYLKGTPVPLRLPYSGLFIILDN